MPVIARAFVPGIGQVERVFNGEPSLQRILKTFRDEYSHLNPNEIKLVRTRTKAPDELTERETEVVQAMIQHECDESAMCLSLFIAPSSLRTHLHNIYQKTGAHSKSQLMAQYIKNPERFGVVLQKEAS